jgi:3-isopropylmalate/(R)-2-methylmalate dehydratase large subunit
MGNTLFEKIWQSHVIENLNNGAGLIYIGRVFLHGRTGSIALKSLELGNRKVVSPEQAFCTMDHIVDTFPGRTDKTTMPSRC